MDNCWTRLYWTLETNIRLFINGTSIKITNHQDCNKENKPTMGSYMIISKEAKKTCDKTQYPYLTKKKTESEIGEHIQHKVLNEQPT